MKSKRKHKGGDVKEASRETLQQISEVWTVVNPLNLAGVWILALRLFEDPVVLSAEKRTNSGHTQNKTCTGMRRCAEGKCLSNEN